MARDDEFDRLVKQTPNPEYDELTPLEQQIKDLVIEGKAGGAIAKRLQISEPSVQRHLATMYKKMYTWKKGIGPSRPFPKTTESG